MTGQKQKVLIVDDSQTNLALLDHMLGQDGCEVVQAKSGIEAVELVRILTSPSFFLIFRCPV